MTPHAITLSAPPGPRHASARATLLNGTVIAGKYRIERPIGHGGMGLVYMARHLELGIQVAVKVMATEAPSQVAAARFTREARAAALLKGEHVARVFDLGTTEEGRPYIAMEYLEGCDLDAYLARHGAMSLPLAVDILLQTCEALGEAHRLGIVHRDLKPSNVFLAEGPGGKTFAKLLDFGISKFLGSASSHTSAGGPVGTPAYMSPEQLRGETLTVAADIWSLGVLLFELLTNETLFEASSFAELSVLVLTTPRPIRMTPGRPELPPLVDRILERCLALDPAERYKSVEELERDLVQLVAYDPRTTGPRRLPVVDREPSSADLHASWTNAPASVAATRRALPKIGFAAGLAGLLAIAGFSMRESGSTGAAASGVTDEVPAASAEPTPSVTGAPVATPEVVPSASAKPSATTKAQAPPATSPRRVPPATSPTTPRPPTRTAPNRGAPAQVDEFGARR